MGCLYDAHGNMIAAVNSNGVMSAQRVFDPWGVIRTANASGDPTGRYCANLGHKQDDESGLVYMRARYYEPASGRILSQDPARSGLNWFSYSDSCPSNRADITGTDAAALAKIAALLLAAKRTYLAGGPYAVDDLKALINSLRAIIKVERGSALLKEALGSEAEADSAFAGPAGEIGNDLGQAEQGEGAKDMTAMVVAKLAIRQIEEYIEAFDGE